MYTYLAYSPTNNQVLRGPNYGSVYGYTGSLANSFFPNTAKYAAFKFNDLNISFPRTNYQVGTFFNINSNIFRFQSPKGFDSGRVNFSRGRDVEKFYSDLKGHLASNKITGIMEIFEEPLNESFEKKDRKSFQEIVNLIIEYGTKAVEIAKSLGIIKTDDTSFDDGWTPTGEEIGNENLEGTGNSGEYSPKVEKKPVADESTLFGFKPLELGLGISVVGLGIYALSQSGGKRRN
ncbi:hypothetical protein [Emticicia sp. W12TSBA100-4]|uniref:hypothetical protein n=1 Tax=Emticicia sp. W12TSBA100-4 TaxID=3160965 RepID=UPI003305800E